MCVHLYKKYLGCGHRRRVGFETCHFDFECGDRGITEYDVVAMDECRRCAEIERQNKMRLEAEKGHKEMGMGEGRMGDLKFEAGSDCSENSSVRSDDGCEE